MIIKNGVVFNNFPEIDGERLDIKIEKGIVRKIAKSILPSRGEEVIDASSLFVIPGIVDIHAHLRTPGYEYKEDFVSGSNAAASGGITTVVAMPNTMPPLDSPDIILSTYDRLKKESIIEVFLSSAMTKKRDGKEIVDLRKNLKAGAIFFTDDGNDINDLGLIEKLCSAGKNERALLFVHPETHSMTNGKFFNYGKLNEYFRKEGQFVESESHSILLFGLVAIKYRTRIHFTHISSAKSLEVIELLKSIASDLITCDVTPHHLLLTEEDLIKPRLDTNKKINPPLRSENDRKALENGIISGIIDCVATDHAPHSKSEKSLEIERAPFGTTGFETLLPSTYTFFVKNKKINMLDWLKLLSYNPSRIIGIDRGTIKKGGLANITVFNPLEEIFVDENFLTSKSKNNAFIGKRFYGCVYYTIYKGKIVYKKKNEIEKA